MSQENVEVVAAMWAAFARQETDVAFSALDAEIEWQMAEDEPDAVTHHGRVQVMSMLRGWEAAFDDFSGTPQEFIDAAEQVIVPLVFVGTPRGGNAQVTFEETQVYTIVDGVIVTVREYRTKAQALKAVGLTE
jgi:ketosteroid isomerase-like protein